MHKRFKRFISSCGLPIRVPLSSCVHYCGFRYGRNEYNPYETYTLEIAEGIRPELAQARFIEFLQYYRPCHLGEALGLGESLTNQYPMWHFPWDENRPVKFSRRAGWLDYPNDCPDILTHFSERGILHDRIEEEFFWLERAWHSIRRRGYRPWRYRNFVRALTLRRADGTEANLLTDGNHRVAAMSALGCDSVQIYRVNKVIAETECDRWPGVTCGQFTLQDALRIFYAYFKGNVNYKTARSAASIITARESHAQAELPSNLELKV